MRKKSFPTLFNEVYWVDSCLSHYLLESTDKHLMMQWHNSRDGRVSTSLSQFYVTTNHIDLFKTVFFAQYLYDFFSRK